MTVEPIKPVNVMGLDFRCQTSLTAMATASYPRFYRGRKRNAQNCASYPEKEKRQE
ncbi:MAG: hypothetical protein LBU04_05365 [Christensenellaceae bacterium]|nr:hypothetical protein [Christensenellaceae bacterium]